MTIKLYHTGKSVEEANIPNNCMIACEILLLYDSSSNKKLGSSKRHFGHTIVKHFVYFCCASGNRSRRNQTHFIVRQLPPIDLHISVKGTSSEIGITSSFSSSADELS